MSGKNISQNKSDLSTQFTNIEQDGFWLLSPDGEYFVSFNRYPGFEHATLAQIFNFRESFGDLHWDELDIDIELDALKHPERYPLVYQEIKQVAEKKTTYK
jgi:hypothetical protein